jgi:glycosyltransferase involved in cell wall biosynthesis
VPVSHARIIYTGLDVERYKNGGEQRSLYHEDPNLNLLYAGRIYPEKGIDIVIEAMIKLVHGQGKRDLRLSLAGSGSTQYENHLHQLVNQAGLSDFVSFLGWVQPDEIPGLLRRFDVLLLPSIWPEPFARVVLEGMISGLVVVATPTGGTKEILRDGENGLLFAAGDAEDLAQKIVRLAADPGLRRRLALAGQQTVVERFPKTKMMDEIESYLQEVFQSSAREKDGHFEGK